MNHPYFVKTIPDTKGRYDIYAVIHKALRKAECELLARLGATDFTHLDAGVVLDDVKRFLNLAARHMAHEEQHIHGELERRVPSATLRIEQQHEGHRLSIMLIEDILDQMGGAPVAEWAALGRRLYLAFSEFVAHDFEHMYEEETANNSRLWAAFSDEELAAIEGGIIASIEPETVMEYLRLMVPASNPDERFVLLNGIRLHAPADAFAAIMEHAVKATLAAADYAAVTARLEAA